MKKRNLILLCIFTMIIVFSINVYAVDCSEVIPTGDGSIMYYLNEYVFKAMKYGAPTLFIVLTSFDFAKVVFTGDEKGMDKAKNNFLKRSVAVLIVFFAPDIINLIVNFIDKQSIASCVNQLTKWAEAHFSCNGNMMII